MKAKTSWRWFNLAVIVAMLLMLVPTGSIGARETTPSVFERPAQQPPQAPPAQGLPEPLDKEPQAVPPTQPPISLEESLAKLHPDLRELAQTASPALPEEIGVAAASEQESIIIEVFAAPGTDLSPYFVDGKVIARPPFGKGEDKTQVFIGSTYPTNLLKIASLDQVRAIIPIVLERNAEPMPYPPDEERRFPEKGSEDWAQLRANADKLREGVLPWDQAKAFGDGRERMQPLDWFEVRPEGPHKAQAAWDRGYRGEGVTVAVLDDGIDAAHPDLMGTQKIYSSTVASQYNGWPMVFSPFSMLIYFFDEYYGTLYIPIQYYESVHYVDTSATPTLTPCGTGISCFTYTPLNSGVPGLEHTYVISNTMSKSGVVHVGTHPDADLRDYVWGEKVAVLVTDPNTAGVYDTVYVDLDDDYDFRDEKPLTRANVNDPNTYNDMIAYRDMNGDGLADISGGMLYFIGDGNTVLPVSDWMWGATCAAGFEFMCPGNGDLVAFSGGTFDGPYSHGTACASNVVGQGVTDGMLPEFADLGGAPAAAVYGMAPEAEMVNVSDIYWNFAFSTIDAYIFAAVGYDGVDQTGWDWYNLVSGATDTDAIQITSNSYGDSAVDNDGWDYEGQVVSQVQRWHAPYLQFLFSTGNGAPAYGTVAPPSPATGIGVGASTEFGSTGWDSITNTTQIMFNDVTPFSNRGPGARGTNGVDVVAGGAFAAGDEELNYYSISTWGAPNGNLSWNSWGGTSRSSPVAMGVLALIDQAFYAANGRWPTYDEAKALLMSSATDLNYDTFTQGGGSVNADRGTAVAGGHYGLYVEGSAPTWQPGDYLGVDYPGFAHITYPGDTFAKTFTIYNTGVQTVTAGIKDTELQLIHSEEFTFTVTSAMVAAESAYGADNRDNFYKAFNYFIPITATASRVVSEPTWANISIPPDTDLMVIRQMFPFDEYDIDGDYSWDNRFYLMVYNWQDVNDDGDVWEDLDSNSVVNFINSGVVSQIDGGQELDWDDSRTELDRWEFGRFSYHRPGSNRNEMWVHDPLNRMIDGLFIGLRHHPSSSCTGDTTLSYRIDFYKEEDVPWLTESTSSLEVSPGASATFVATTTVPADMPAGMYEAAIQIHDPGLPPTYTTNTSVIPVALSVAAVFTDGLQLGGYDTYNDTYNADRPYNNATVRGLFDWTGRAESGDWRFFFTDVPDSTYPADTKVLVRDEWDDAAPYTDIDTIVLGPTSTSLGTGLYDFPEPSFYGPYVLDTVGKSPNTNVGGGTWQFDTSSESNEDWVTAPIQDGLHEFLQHNVLFEGLKFDVVFTKTLGTLQEDPHTFSIDTYVDQGQVGVVTMTASLPLNGLVADAYGLGGPEYFTNEPIEFVNSNTTEWTHVFNVSHAAKIILDTSSADISDIDLYLFYWTGTTWAQVGSSATSGADEHIELIMPDDGDYLVGINNWSGPAGHFNLTKVVVQGYDLTVSGLPVGAIAANTPVTFTVSFSRTMVPGETHEGLLLVGPPEAPALKEISITINRADAIEKTVDKALAFAGDELQYVISLNNVSDPDTVRLVDPIPANTDYVSVDNATYEAAKNRIVFAGTLTDTRLITLTVRITDTVAADTWITNTGTLTATTLFPEEVSASAGTHVGDGRFATSYKTATAQAPGGDIITYTIHISNTGDALAYVALTDPIPVSTTLDSYDTDAPCQHFTYNATLSQMEWAGNVAPDEEWVFTFWVRPDNSAAWTTITNTVTIVWDGNTMDLVDSTEILPPYKIYMPIIRKNAP